MKSKTVLLAESPHKSEISNAGLSSPVTPDLLRLTSLKSDQTNRAKEL
jgi:hypothetical protein